MSNASTAIDGKWLETILKASGWKTGAVGTGCGVLLLLRKLRFVELHAYLVQALIVVGVVCGCLCLSSAVAALWSEVKPRLAHRMLNARTSAEVLSCLPHLSAKEREIIGTLFAKRSRFFTADDDCGHANTLVAKGIVVRSPYDGSTLSWNIPFEIPAHIWRLLGEHIELFPKCDPEGEPWRIHWTER